MTHRGVVPGRAVVATILMPAAGEAWGLRAERAGPVLNAVDRRGCSPHHRG
jgi:hypothetical protein